MALPPWDDLDTHDRSILIEFAAWPGWTSRLRAKTIYEHIRVQMVMEEKQSEKKEG